MMRTVTTMLAAAVVMAGSAQALSAQPLQPNTMTAGRETPAQRKIALARERIARDARSVQGYNDLAMALTQRARETSSPTFYLEAEEAVRKSLALAPDNFEALKVKTWALLGQHRFAEALAVATTLNRQVPDDLMVYGMLTDANIELGRYDDAEKSAQWMLDLRPGNIPALTRAAYLRELFGDIDGALELMRSAVNRMPFNENEDRAWVMTQIAHLELVRHRPEAAEQAAQAALALFPEYHYALGVLADVRTAQGRHGEAADLQARRYAVATHPENLFELAEAEARAGRRADAATHYAAFEAGARKEMTLDDNANRELIAYYAGAGNRPKEALAVAEAEIAKRGDVYTRDAYAWALYRNGRTAEAKREIATVLAVGVQHPRIRARRRDLRGTAKPATGDARR
ncbi:MAG: tetratricopeptide repeat protein [Vicinamibacterales bacterium]